jgi:hypothetical protein
MKMVSLVTVILMVTVFLLHGMNYFTKLLLGVLLFAGWLLFAIVRSVREPFMIDGINPSDAPDALDGMLRSNAPAAHWARLPLPPERFVPFGPATFNCSVRPIFCDH